MENAGCVTFREDYVFRSKVTDARYERRADLHLAFTTLACALGCLSQCKRFCP